VVEPKRKDWQRQFIHDLLDEPFFEPNFAAGDLIMSEERFV
jgi:hypothetical protein